MVAIHDHIDTNASPFITNMTTAGSVNGAGSDSTKKQSHSSNVKSSVKGSGMKVEEKGTKKRKKNKGAQKEKEKGREKKGALIDSHSRHPPNLCNNDDDDNGGIDINDIHYTSLTFLEVPSDWLRYSPASVEIIASRFFGQHTIQESIAMNKTSKNQFVSNDADDLVNVETLVR